MADKPTKPEQTRSGSAMPEELLPEVTEQIDSLNLEPGRPLVISDADEVLLKFCAGLERYLDSRDLWLDLQSFALAGNIKSKATGDPVPREEMPALLKAFYDHAIDALDAVDGAADALAALAGQDCQIVVLTNVPLDMRDARAGHLASHGMDYPVVANQGLKGPAIARLAERTGAPVAFLDDIPHNLNSAARAHAPARLIHFVADKRLAKLIEPAKVSHHHTSEWPDARAYLEDWLKSPGN